MEYHSRGLQEKLIKAKISQLLHGSVFWKELHGVLHGRSCWEFTLLVQLHVKLHMKLLKKPYQRGQIFPTSQLHHCASLFFLFGSPVFFVLQCITVLHHCSAKLKLLRQSCAERALRIPPPAECFYGMDSWGKNTEMLFSTRVFCTPVAPKF